MAVTGDTFSVHFGTKIYWCRTESEVTWLVRQVARGQSYSVKFNGKDVTNERVWAEEQD